VNADGGRSVLAHGIDHLAAAAVRFAPLLLALGLTTGGGALASYVGALEPVGVGRLSGMETIRLALLGMLLADAGIIGTISRRMWRRTEATCRLCPACGEWSPRGNLTCRHCRRPIE
jgi:hypothetical protein